MKDIRKRIKENKYYLIFLCVFFVLAIFLNSPFKNGNSEYTIKSEKEAVGVSDLILKDTQISQKFIAKDNNLRKIGILSATYENSVTSNINVKIIDTEKNEKIFENNIELKDLEDNSFLEINIANQSKSKNKEYEIIITGLDNCVENNAISFWLANETSSENENINSDKELIISTTYLNKKIKVLSIFVWILLFIASATFILFFMNEKADEKMFLKMSIVLGFFIIIVMPICNPYDEYSHLFRALMISQGDFYDKINEEGKIGGYIADNYGELTENGIISLKTLSFDIKPLITTLSKNKEFYEYIYFSSTVPTGHSIQAIGILIGRLLHLGFVPMVWLGRIMSYVFYVACSYFALKNMKYYKSTLFLIVTIPISLFIAGGISLDPIINGACFLFTSICLKYYFEKDNDSIKITKKDIGLIFFTALLILTNKYLTFTPLLLLFFIIPRNKFESKKQYKILILLAVVLGLLCVLWQFKLLNMFDYQEDRNGNVNQKEQISFIIEHPVFASRVILNTMLSLGCVYLDYFSTTSHDSAISIIGKSVGMLVFMGAILEINKPKVKNRKINLILIFTFIIIYVLSILALYLSYTPVGKEVVEGYQIRYLVPMLMLLLIPIANVIKVDNKIKNYERKIIFLMFLANLDTILGVVVNIFSN